MVIIGIEHAVADFDAWRAAFESDPLGRAKGGVRRYRVLRPIDDEHHVRIELEFAGREEAAAFRSALERMWSMPGPAALGIGRPEVTVSEVAASGEYA